VTNAPTVIHGSRHDAGRVIHDEGERRIVCRRQKVLDIDQAQQLPVAVTDDDLCHCIESPTQERLPDIADEIAGISDGCEDSFIALAEPVAVLKGLANRRHQRTEFWC
jgi:hypothetical protein